MTMHRHHRPPGGLPRLPPPPRPRTVSPSAVAPEAAAAGKPAPTALAPETSAHGASPPAAPGPHALVARGGVGGAGVAARDHRPVQVGRLPDRPGAEREAPPDAPRHPGGTLRLPSRPRTEAPVAVAVAPAADAAPAVVPETAPASPLPEPGAVAPEAPAPVSPDPAEVEAARAAAAVRRREQAREVLAMLRARWPAAFPTPVPRPLASGIHHEIKRALEAAGEAPVPSQALRAALYHWTNTPGYLAAMANGARRVRLDGTDAEEPDEEKRRQARDLLAERKLWMKPPAASVSDTPAGGEGGESAEGGEGERPGAERADAG